MKEIKKKNTDFPQHEGFTIAPTLFDFIEASVIPATNIEANAFWYSFASLVTTANTDNQHCSSDRTVQIADAMIPVRTCSKPISAKWGSLYEALYHDNVIPHTAGLKPGSSINLARHERVVRCAKDFLDKTFPLTEGSHQDAISYMAYYQNLLVILADGSTTGLKSAKQFVAKTGPSDSPDSILLEHNGTHTEILFDCNCENGSKDLARIDDIRLEATHKTLFDFEASSPEEKCIAYENWIVIVQSQRDETFLSCINEKRSISSSKRAITTSEADELCTLVHDQNGAPVPDSIVDAIVAAIIETAYSDNKAPINLCFNNASIAGNDMFITELERLLSGIYTGSTAKTESTTTKVFSASADIRANSTIRATITTSDSEHLSNPLMSAIDTMHSYGYEVPHARSI